jgi:hypothetical protein
MPWPLKLMPGPVAFEDRQPGMMWFCRQSFYDAVGPGHFSPNYYADWAGKRLPLTIVMPGGTMWCPDICPDWGTNVDVGWKVTGEVPLLTAYPSIGKPDYHGWLKDGVLSDDLEGRTYPS